MRKLLSISMTILSLSFTQATFAQSSYVCEQAYTKTVKKYEKSIIRKIAKTALPTAGAGAIGAAMFTHFGAQMTYALIIWSPGIAMLALGGAAGTALFDVADRGPEIMEAKAILDLAKFSEEEVDAQFKEQLLQKLVEAQNAQRTTVGLPSLNDEEIALIAKKIEDEKREKNLFDKFVRKVNKKRRNTKLSYEEVRETLLDLANRDRAFCPKNRKGKERPVTINKLVKITKNEILNK